MQMRNSTLEPMDSSSVCCPNAMCCARGQRGLGNIVIHDHKLHIGIVIKRTKKKRVIEITRRMAHGLQSQAEQLLLRSGGGTILNTAFIEH